MKMVLWRNVFVRFRYIDLAHLMEYAIQSLMKFRATMVCAGFFYFYEHKLSI